MERYPPSGLSVLVVGGGIAGLGFAIEGYRKGHDIRIVERRPDFHDYGDLISIGASALHSPNKWPGFLEACRATPFSNVLRAFKSDNTFLGPMVYPLGLSRAHFHHVLHQYTLHLGIPISFSSKVEEYFETDDRAGVVLENGTKHEADIVVASDGIGTRSWRLVSGSKEKPISSTFAMFRTTFPVEIALQSPSVAKEFEDMDVDARLYFGDGAHLVLGKTQKDMIWMLTHKDDGTAEEDWAKPTSPKKALPYIKGWTPWLTDLVNITPEDRVVDFKLMWRNTSKVWHSPRARVIQIGDAAHTFLPTSASGATMALEDAFSLASLLQIAGKGHASLALKAQTSLRYERVTCAQKMGFKNRENWHNTDWDAIAKDPSILLKQVGDWVSQHDPELYAYDAYGKCIHNLITGAPFENTNIPPGHHTKPWTVAELLAYADRGERIIDDGDWS
ncbi:maackiain detoxification [Fusarium tricinctum]|uniref:Maackiain detoxification n=1 Tax=Fusarium tricinctum TaxID=61284 RepID=A0A8K0RMJ0_9HYPO|nr:maackiain detoxification [Fusarium tricinctum]